MERLSEFDFEVLYVPGENVLPDALSRMYEFDAPGTIQSHKEYLQCDLDIGSVDLTPPTGLISAPLLVGQEAIASNVRRSHRLADKYNVPADFPALVAKPRHSRAKPMPSAGGGKTYLQQVRSSLCHLSQ